MKMYYCIQDRSKQKSMSYTLHTYDSHVTIGYMLFTREGFFKKS